MVRILAYEPSFRRIAGQVAEATKAHEVLLVGTDGAITLNGAPVDPDAAEVEVGWATADMFFSPAARQYFAVVLKSNSLKWVQSSAAGYDSPVFGMIVSKGARLTTNHSQAVGMSEYVLATVLDHFQRGPDRRVEQAAARWTPLNYREIAGSNWLIVGFGAIGQETARRARAFGAKIVGVRRQTGPEPLADAMATPDALPSLLPGADVVVLSLPLNANTANMVDAAFLAAMKPGSVLVNVGRGGLVDEAALLAALDAGKPEHAILDVFQTEPLPAESRFWSHPRVTATPHASPMGSGLQARSDALFVDNLTRYLAGEPLLNEVSAKEVLGT
jgi:phosphoglycerate dehydrogenase-like enzyme